MQPSRKSIDELFNPQVRYVVPMFQRKYVWQADPQWQNLWDDIEEKVDFRLSAKKTHPHYLGALIVEGVKPISGNEVTRMLVIDGQQRLTTLQLLICAYRDVARKNEWVSLDRRLSRLLENSDQDVMDEPDEEKFKVWPTTLNRNVFSSIVTAGGLAAVQKLHPLVRLPRKRNAELRSNLVEAYFYFSRKIQEWIVSASGKYQKNEESCATALLQSLNEDFFVIHLSLSEADDAQKIFYSLNSKATPLSQSDLMRSLIFMRAEKEGHEKDKIFKDYWGKLETDFWSFEFKRGGRTASRLDVGLRNFLTSKTGSLIDARRVSEEYRQWITVVPPRYTTVRDELHDLMRHCELYRDFETAPSDLPSTDFKRLVRDLDVSTVMPLVQFLELDAVIDRDQTQAALNMLESFIVRRQLVGDETKEYNKFFVEVIGEIRKCTGIELIAALEMKLMSGGGSTRRWPNDEEVAEQVYTRAVYQVLRTPALRLILERIELSLRGKKTENLSIDKDITIEHVLPDKWPEHWHLQGVLIPQNVANYPTLAKDEMVTLIDAIRDRNSKCQTLGNLSLLNRRANPAAGNLSFEKKKIEYANSVLRLNRYFEPLDLWDESSIRDRAKLMAEQICSIWPRPQQTSK